jgi:hypothetical protein
MRTRRIRRPGPCAMTTRLIAIAVVLGGTAIMVAVTLVIGILRGDDPPEADLPEDSHGKPGDGQPRSHLNY